MDPRFNGILNSSSGVGLENQSMAEYSNGKTGNGARFGISYPDHKLVNEHRNHGSSFQEHCIGGVHLVLNQPFSNGNGSVYSSFVDIDDDCDFSDAVLSYIDQILMEEDMEEKTHMLQESLDLQAKEKSFYDVLGKKYPPSPQQGGSAVVSHESSDDNPYVSCLNSTTSSSDGSGYLIDIVGPSWINSRTDHDASVTDCGRASKSSVSSSNSLSNFMDGFSDSPISPLQLRDVYNESQLVWNFRRGVDEASKFLPVGNNLLVNVGVNTLATQDPKEGEIEVKNDVEKHLPSGSRGKKNRANVDVDLEEERSSKLPAVYGESDYDVPMEEFDDVLLHTMGEREKKFAAYREILQNASGKGAQQNGQTKRPSGGRGRGKKQNRKKEVIDLRTLLINCAQAVAADDRRNASELLKQIRQHASPFGEGNQRLAYYFADGLEARLTGTGSQIHKALVNKKTIAADYLKAYYTYLASSPFRKISNFTSNKTIMNQSLKAMRVHVIDFGILYGFQWPTLIQRIAERPGGPPKLRITGIDFPQPGFRPAERIEETGRRLARYAKQFNVPFEYNAIAKKWETVKIEDLKIEKGEFVVVNCMYRAKNLLDETVLAESARTMVLNLIRNINPDIFIHGIVNGAYSAPFFVTRFREVLFHFSALFDMLESNIPREKPERMHIERDIFGREALNAIACEGWERVERPETYKQWQVRHLRAGFAQVPLQRELMNRAIYKVRAFYHKDFVIDEDSQWLLMGWKGRIIYAISCWKPV